MLWTENKNLKVNGTNYYFFSKTLTSEIPFWKMLTSDFFSQSWKNNEGPRFFLRTMCGIDAALRELLKNILTFPTRGGSGGVGSMFWKKSRKKSCTPTLRFLIKIEIPSSKVNGTNYFFSAKTLTFKVAYSPSNTLIIKMNRT